MWCALKTKDSEGEGGGCRAINLLLSLICYCDMGGGEYTCPIRYVALKPVSIHLLSDDYDITLLEG